MPRLSLVLCLLAIPAAAEAQTATSLSAWPRTSSWVTHATARCGEVVGRIVRWPSFVEGDTLPKPMLEGFVRMGYGSPSIGQASNGLVLDASGEFMARLDTARITIVGARAVGHAPATIALDREIAKAFVVEVIMRATGPKDSQRGTSVYVVRAINSCVP